MPDYAYNVEEFVRSHNGSPPRNHVSGRPWRNDRLQLPPHFGPFREYDVHVHVGGQNRGDERIVLGHQRHAAWYTPDHYETFNAMHPVGCWPIIPF